MAIAVGHAVSVGEHQNLHFQLPGLLKQNIEISAQVMWLSESRKAAGIRFVHPPEEARNHISNWIASERSTREFEYLLKPLHRDARPVEISPGRSRTVPSNQLISGGDTYARYAEMFPSETAGSTIAAKFDEIQSLATVDSNIQHAKRIPGPLPEVSVHGISDTPAPALSSKANKRIAAERIEDDSPSRLPEGSPETGFKFQFVVLASLLVAVSFVLGLTAGYAPIRKSRVNARKSMLPLTAGPPSSPDVSSESRSAAPTNGNTFNTPSAETPDSEKSLPEISTARSHSRPEDVIARAKRIAPYSPRSNRSKADFNGPPDSQRHGELASNGAIVKGPQKLGERSVVVPSRIPRKPSSTTDSEISANSQNQPNLPNRSNTPNAESPLSTATPKPESAHQPAPDGASRDFSPRSVAPATTTAPYTSAVPTNVAIPSAEQGKLVRAVFPQKSIVASPSLAINAQLSVVIPPESRSSSGDHQTARLRAGDLMSYATPRQPRAADRYKPTETVKVRATIGTGGQVTDIKAINGPIFLISSAISAVRQWRFRPTLLNDMPVQAQEDITIEFRRSVAATN